MKHVDLTRDIYSLLVLFGERYIHVSEEQALLDCKYSRDSMIKAFSAIVRLATPIDAHKSSVNACPSAPGGAAACERLS